MSLSAGKYSVTAEPSGFVTVKVYGGGVVCAAPRCPVGIMDPQAPTSAPFG